MSGEERPLTNFMTIEFLKVYAVQKNGDWVDRIMGLDPFSNEFAGSDYPISAFFAAFLFARVTQVM